MGDIATFDRVKAQDYRQPLITDKKHMFTRKNCIIPNKKSNISPSLILKSTSSNSSNELSNVFSNYFSSILNNFTFTNLHTCQNYINNHFNSFFSSSFQKFDFGRIEIDEVVRAL